MGLFSRNEPAARSDTRRNSRSSASSEAQAAELRGRARRRLIGALALVVAAVIILPVLFNKPPESSKTPVVAQVTIPATPPANSAQPASLQPGAAQPDVSTGGGAAGQEPLPAPQPIQPDSDSQAEASKPADTAKAPESAAKTEKAARPGKTAQAEKATDKKADKSRQSESSAQHDASADKRAKVVDHGPGSTVDKVKRTDDGAVALALLQGRTPGQGQASSAAGDHGKYVLQIAAYTTRSDADSRRGRLVAAGVTNAYVESAVSGGKPTYRLRVGPFPTREAAQAAQARLRALGYDNGFISSK